jgi:hypothetical protein
MVHHMVLFKLRPDCTDQQRDDFLKALKGLKEHIGVITDLSAGPNFAERNKGFEYGLSVFVKSRSDLATYQEHPEHQRVLNQYIKPILDDIVAVDYEFEA